MIIKIKRVLTFKRMMSLIHYYQLSNAHYINFIIYKAYEDKFYTINIISIVKEVKSSPDEQPC